MIKTLKTKNVFKFKLSHQLHKDAQAIIPANLTFDTFLENLKGEASTWAYKKAAKQVEKQAKKDKKQVEKPKTDIAPGEAEGQIVPIEEFDEKKVRLALINSGFQSLVEAMILFFDQQIGISDYLPINSVNHKYQTYGMGKRNGAVATTFIMLMEANKKTLQNPPLTDGNSQITEYFAESCYLRGFDLSANEKIFNIFTDATAIHEKTIENFVEVDKTQFYGINEIRALIDGNVDFWDAYRQSLVIEEETEQVGATFDPDPDQEEALADLMAAWRKAKSTKKHVKHQVIWPTGTGKGEIMMELTLAVSAHEIKNKRQPKILIAEPRIALISQGIQKLIKRLLQHGHDDYTFVSFSSGEGDTDSFEEMGYNTENFVDTTNIEELKKAIRKSKGPLFVFTTYHSAIKIIQAKIKFSLINCDEAHNIVKGRSIPKESRESIVSPMVSKLTPMQVFYTATQALSGTPDFPVLDDNGMDNITKFGTIISKKTPKYMIEQGKIVRPQLYHFKITEAIIGKHILSKDQCEKAKNGETQSGITQEEITTNAELNSFIVWNSFFKAEEENKKHSLDSTKNGTKMLVKCYGGQSYAEFFESETFKKYQLENPDVGIYGISSVRGIYINGEYFDYNSQNVNLFMQVVGALPAGARAIIFHIAIIGEGWDVPGINAIMPFGEMSDITSSQTLGRGMRLSTLDRPRLKSGEIVPSDCYNKKFIKPFCYIVMPEYEGWWHITGSSIKRMVGQIQDNIGYCPYEMYESKEPPVGPRSPTPPPPLEKYVVPEGVEFEFERSILKSLEDEKKMAAFNRTIENRRKEIRAAYEKISKKKVKKAL